MGNPVNKTEQTEAQKIIETIEEYLANAEKLLKKAEDVREGTLKPSARENYAKKIADSYRSWRKDVEGNIDLGNGYSEEVERKSRVVLRRMDDLARIYRNADTRELEQKRAEFAEKRTQLLAAPELPDLYQEVMQAFDANLTKFDQTMTDGQDKLKKFIAEAGKELEALKKDQEEILKKQEALDKADFQGNRENAQKLLEEQQKKVTDRGQKLRDTFAADVHVCVEQINQANRDLDAANRENERILTDTDQKKAFLEKEQHKRGRNLMALDESCQDMREYCVRTLLKFREPQKRAELETVFGGISDTKAGVTGLLRRKKDDTAFQNMKAAVTDYLQNGGEKKAAKAYEECRNYLAGWMEDYGKLKKGSKTENIRNQGVVRMLELMEEMPDFQSSLKIVDTRKHIHPGEPGEGWAIVEDKDEASRYKRINFEALEKSLATHSAESKQAARHVGNNGNSKSFTDLDKRIDEKKAKARAAQQKAAAKAAKDAAKAAKAAKKAKGKAK